MNTSSQRRILITGATGFIGRQLCASWAVPGTSMRALVRDEPKPPLPGPDTEILVGSLENYPSLLAACQDVDTIIHLAGFAHVNAGDASACEQINLQGTRNLLQAATDASVPRLIFVSSVLAGDTDQGVETTAYGASKLAAEKLLLEARQRGQINCLIMRLSSVYGPGMEGQIARLIRMSGFSWLPPLPRLQTKLSMIAVEDVSGAIQRAVEHQDWPSQIVILCDGKDYSLNALEDEIRRLRGRESPVFRPPLVLLYAPLMVAGLVGKVLGLLGLRALAGRLDGFRIWRKLRRDSLHRNNSQELLDFKPRFTFQDRLPDILDAFRADQTRH